MEKLLITGFSGFVAKHFLKFLYDNSIGMEILGVDLNEPDYSYDRYADKLEIDFKKINLLDIRQLRDALIDFKPDYVLHLASYSSVAYSWKNPTESFTNNTNIFLNLVNVIHELNIKCRILSVGSSEAYGNVSEIDLPLRETSPLWPVSPYAVARVSQEMLAQVYVDSFGLDIVMTRSFNHIGPWQDTRFVVPSFIKRILEIKEKGLSEGTIETGDTTIIRDFVDVRDVVRAYCLLLTRGEKGEIYNVCSGKGIILSELIEIIAEEIGVKVSTVVNPDYVRKNDNKIIIGSADKIRDDLGWKPKIDLRTTLRETVEAMSTI